MQAPNPPQTPTLAAAARRGKLFYSLVAVMAGIAMAPLLFTAWRLVEVNREPLETNWKEYQMLAATSLATEINITLERVEAQINQVSMAFEWGGAQGMKAMLQRMGETQFLQNYLGRDIVLLRVKQKIQQNHF